MDNYIRPDQAVDHAWRYFELHSSQRITLFNYYLFIATALGAGVGAILQASDDLNHVGAFLSLFMTIISFIFWKLDQRTAFLIKQSETFLKKLEKSSFEDIGIFCNESANLSLENNKKNYFTKIVTYGMVFRFIFTSSALLGMGGIIFFATKILSCSA